MILMEAVSKVHSVLTKMRAGRKIASENEIVYSVFNYELFT